MKDLREMDAVVEAAREINVRWLLLHRAPDAALLNRLCHALAALTEALAEAVRAPPEGKS